MRQPPVTILIAILVAIPYMATADSNEQVGDFRPGGRLEGAAIWIGGFAYVIGGGPCSGGRGNEPPGCPPTDEIVRFDPRDNSVRVMGAHLPTGRLGMSAATDGTYGYIFGGKSSWSNGDGGIHRDILRFDPESDTLITMNATLPAGHLAASAAWVGGFAYIIGGYTCCSYSENKIVRYDPVEDSTIIMNASIPTWPNYEQKSSASDGNDNIFVFGALGSRIYKYHVPSDTASVMNATLPGEPTYSPTVFIRGYFYMFGGYEVEHGGWCGYAQRCDAIARYDPLQDQMALLQPRLNAPTQGAMAATNGVSAYIFGGCPSWNCTSSTIQSFTPSVGRDILAPRFHGVNLESNRSRPGDTTGLTVNASDENGLESVSAMFSGPNNSTTIWTSGSVNTPPPGGPISLNQTWPSDTPNGDYVLTQIVLTDPAGNRNDILLTTPYHERVVHVTSVETHTLWNGSPAIDAPLSAYFIDNRTDSSSRDITIESGPFTTNWTIWTAGTKAPPLATPRKLGLDAEAEEAHDSRRRLCAIRHEHECTVTIPWDPTSSWWTSNPEESGVSVSLTVKLDNREKTVEAALPWMGQALP